MPTFLPAFRSAGGKLTAMFSLIVVLFAVVAGFVLYNNERAAVESAVSLNAQRLAASIAAEFDSETYGEFLTNPVENDTYWLLRDRLDDIRKTTGAMYVYTLRVDNEKQTFIMIDGQPKQSDVASPINEPAFSDGTDGYVDAALNGATASTPVVNDPEYGTYLSAYAPIQRADGAVIGILGVDIEATDLENIISIVFNKSMPLYAAIAFLTLAFLALAYFMTRRILRPLQDLTQAVSSIASGRFAEAEELLNRRPIRSKDEIGALYQASISMNQQLGGILHKIRTDVSASSERMAQAAVSFADDAGSLLQHTTALSNMLHDIESDSKSQQMTAYEAANSMEEMSNVVMRVSETAASLAETSLSAIRQAEDGTQSMDRVSRQIGSIAHTSAELVNGVGQLETRSRNIGQVLAMITDLSAQTKLLALNASIEAAHAGEHGQGFAVVASEIRKLAEQSSAYTDSIKEMLQAIQQGASEVKLKIEDSAREISDGRAMLEEALATFRRIVHLFRDVSGQMGETSAAAQEMSAGIEQVTASVADISHIAKKTSDRLTEAAAYVDKQLSTSRNVSGSAKHLQQSADSLQANLHAFDESGDKERRTVS